MNFFPRLKSQRGRIFLAVALLFCARPVVAAPPTATGTNAVAPKISEPPRPRLSVFEEKVKGAKDPFFTSSARRTPKLVTGKTVAPVDQTKDLILRGLTGSKSRRLALINNQTFSEGEQADVKVPIGKIRVRCVEIRDQSVIITVEGSAERKEIRLKDF